MKRPFFAWSGMLAACSLLLLLAAGCTSARTSLKGKEGKKATASQGVRTAVATPPLDEAVSRRYDEFFLEAICQNAKGDYAAAYELLRHALTLNPNASEGLYVMAQMEEGLNPDSVRQAERLYRRAVECMPGNYYYRQTLSDFYLRHNNVDEACAMYEQMADDFPEHRSDLLYELAGIYRQRQKYDSMIRTLDRLEEQEGKSEDISIEKTNAYQALGKPQEAFAEAQALCDQYPGDSRFKVMLGDLYLKNDNPDRALKIYHDVLKEEPSNAYAHVSLFNYYGVQGQDSLFRVEADSILRNPRIDTQIRASVMTALIQQERLGGLPDSTWLPQLLRRVVTLPQEDNRLRTIYAGYMALHKQPTDSLAPVLEQMLEFEPENPNIRLQLLEYSLRSDSMENAVRLCRAGCQYSPTETAYFYYGGIALFRLGRNADALQMLQAGTATIGKSTASSFASDYYALLGDLRHEMGERQKAYAAYDSALTYKPDNLMCLNNYAYFLSLEKQNLSKAAAMSRRTIDVEPQNATFLDTYAWILFVQERYAEARLYIDETLKHSTPTAENATLYEHAGDIYSRAGLAADAVRFWEQALQLGADTPVLKKKIRLRKYISQ